MKKTALVLLLLVISVSAVASTAELYDLNDTELSVNVSTEEGAEELSIADIAESVLEVTSLEDERITAIEKIAECIATDNMKLNELQYILELAAGGYKLDKLLDVYRFLKLTDEDVSYIPKIYDEAFDFDDALWIEKAYERLTVAEEDMLALEDMYYYTDNGIDIDEILMAYEMSFKNNIKIKEALDARINGESWKHIAVTGYMLDESAGELLPDNLRDINRVITIARSLEADITDVLNPDTTLSKNAINAYSAKLAEKKRIRAELQRAMGIPESDEIYETPDTEALEEETLTANAEDETENIEPDVTESNENTEGGKEDEV